MKHHLAVISTATLAIASMVTLVPSGIARAGNQYDCTSSYMCLWQNSNFEGARLTTQLDTNSLAGTAVGNDAASSGYNRTTWSGGMKVWEHADCAGAKSQYLGNGVADSQLNYNDVASALDVWGQAACGS